VLVKPLKLHAWVSLRGLLVGSLILTGIFMSVGILVEGLCSADGLLRLRRYLFLMSGTVAPCIVILLAAHLLRQRGREVESTQLKFRSLLESAPDAIVITDRDGRIMLVNTQTEKLFGYSRDDLLGNPVESLLRRQDLGGPGSSSLTDHTFTTGRQANPGSGFIGRCRDGKEIFVDVSSSPLQTQEGFLVISSVRDVTERKLAERRRSARHAVRRVLSEATTLDAATPGVLQAVCAGLGWEVGLLWLSEPRTRGLGCLGLWHAPGMATTELEPLRGGCSASSGVGLPSRVLGSGQTSWVADPARESACPRLAAAARLGFRGVLGFPILLGGEVFGAVEVFSQSAEEPDAELLETLNNIGNQLGQFVKRKRAEQAVYESEARKTAILEAALDAIITMDHEGTIVEFNPAAERVFGFARADVVGKEMAGLILPEGLRDRYRQCLASQPAGDENPSLGQRHELTALRADSSEFPVELTITPIRLEGSPLFTAYLRDLSERKRTEATLQKTEEQFRQMQKMEAVGRLAGGVAHDFNNLLTVITGYSDMLLEMLAADGGARGLVEEIAKAGERAASLTRQLLAFSRKQVLEPRVLNLNTVVADMNKLLERLIGEDIDLATLQASNLAAVKADPGQLEQVLLNLAVNARDAMPHGGKLTIATSMIELNEADANAPDLPPGPYVLLTVNDTGCGMEPAVKARIFEPFYTTKETGKGTGLGLATVYGIIKQSGGHITVSSEPGRGTTFKIYLPCVEEPVAPLTPPPPRCDEPRGAGTVLLVEDEDGVRRLTREILQSNGYTVLEARHAGEALQLYERYGDPVQLVVTDMVMPGMNGHELAQQLLKKRPGLKVLFLSGYTDSVMLRNGLLDLGNAFLQKPFTPKALATKVRELLCA
jgi:PAS domain S-box-containing protein